MGGIGMTGKTHTPEFKEAARQRKLGTKHSPETLEKMRVASKARWAKVKCDTLPVDESKAARWLLEQHRAAFAYDHEWFDSLADSNAPDDVLRMAASMVETVSFS